MESVYARFSDPTIVAAFVAAMVTGSGILVTRIARSTRSYLRDRVTISRISSRDDPRVVGIQELFAELFPEASGTHYASDDITYFMGSAHSDTHHVAIEDVILAIVWRGRVAGFLTAHFYVPRGLANISYLGITRDARKAKPRAVGTRMALDKLRSILRKRNCDYILFDLERGDPQSDDTVSRGHRSRHRLFSRQARDLGVWSGQLNIDYIAPRVNLEPHTREQPFTLHVVPLRTGPIETISKLEAMRLIEFTYLDCYGDFYPVESPKFLEHRLYLQKFVDSLEESLPDQVRLLPFGGA